MFGRPVPKEIVEKRGEPVRYWGARAIFHPGTKHPIDLIPDRQGCQCAEGLASKPLLDWLNTMGMKELQKMRAFKRLTSDSAEVVEFKDGQFTVQCSPTPPMAIFTSGRGSIGRRTAGMSRRNRTPRRSGAATSSRSPPSAQGSRPASTASGRASSPGISLSTAIRASRSIAPKAMARFLPEARRQSQAGAVFRRRSDGSGSR